MMVWFDVFWFSLSAFIASAALIAIFGIRMTHVARELAEISGLGQAFFGAVFIGAATSLSGITASATAAWHGEAELAISNSLGGIAAQTMFLVLGDMFYRKANLEFAAASVENLMMSAQLMLLLSILLIGFILPDAGISPVHPVSVLLILAYVFTVKMLADTHERPMWLPRMVRGTVTEKKEKRRKSGLPKIKKLALEFAICAGVVAFSGWLIANAGMALVQQSGISAGVMGGVLIAISTSLPELVIAITAVRMGALTLAVGDIIGGNAFDTLFIAVSDLFYTQGSIFMAISDSERIWLTSAMLMNCILLLGLMYRERRGFGNIGMESSAIMLVYLSTLGFLLLR